MYSKEEIIKHLGKDEVRNINIIHFINEYPIDEIFRVGDSVLLKGKSDEHWTYISSKSKEELRELTKYIYDNDEHFAIIEDWMLPDLLIDRKITWQLSCMKLYLPNNVILPENQCNVVELTADAASYIYENSKYKVYTSVDYIKERINRGNALGICENAQLVAWIMTHDDGAMGFLNVLENYRKKGYGYELTLALIQRLRNLGQIPFVHIEEDNEKSMNLALKLGFAIDRRIHWLQAKKL